MKELEQIIRQHSRNYPAMQPQDVAKLIYQNEFGPGHFVEAPERSLQRLKEEYFSMRPLQTEACLQETERENKIHSLIEPIGNGFVRCCLQGLEEKGLSILNRIFVLTANNKKGTKKNYERKLFGILNDFDRMEFSFDKKQYVAYIEGQKEKDYPIVSHSETYRQAYAPGYRVIDERYASFLPLLAALEKKRKQKEGTRLVVGIDGNSAAGKTTLAQCLSELYECEVIHMDDFFLPPSLRTEERLAEAGGNVHYERFLEETAKGIQSGRDFSYRTFSCKQMDYTGNCVISGRKMLVVEGAYSMRPEFRELYDFKVFMKLPLEKQLERIRKRNGEEQCEIFRTRWIPMENNYFEVFQVEASCDFIISGE